MSDEATTTLPSTWAAHGPQGLRERVSRNLFRSQVRSELEKELAKRARSKKAKPPFAASAALPISFAVEDEDIDRAADQADAEAPPAHGLEGVQLAPVLDWIRANPDKVKRVVEILIGLLLG